MPKNSELVDEIVKHAIGTQSNPSPKRLEIQSLLQNITVSKI